MGVMTRLRDNTHIIILVFAVIFIAFWVLSDLDVGTLLQGNYNELGEIDGKPITYAQYSQMVDLEMQSRRQQQDRELNDNEIATIREQVWDDFIKQAVVERAVEDLGIVVTDDEVRNVFYGPNPPQALAQYFIDSTGSFNRQAYQQFLANPGPENREALLQMEEQVRAQLIRDKLTALLSAAIQVSDDELLIQYENENRRFSCSYVLFDAQQLVPPDTSRPSDEELRAYYDAHMDEFKTEPSRVLDYVQFILAPSKDDTSAVLKDLTTLKNRVAEGGDFVTEALLYTTKLDTVTGNISQIDPALADSVISASVGDVIGPVATREGFALKKVLEIKDGKETFVHARHILLGTEKSEEEAKRLAEEVARKARSGERFEDLATKYSTGPTATRGGDLGWFGKGRMVKEFEKAAFSGKVGDIIGPIKTQFGYHVIKIEGRESRLFTLVGITLRVEPGSTTKDEVYERARSFAYFAKENGFDEEAKIDNYEILQTPEFQKTPGAFIPGIGVNSSLLKFAFENSVGEISDVFQSSQGYVVARVAKEIPAGYRSFEDVVNNIVPLVQVERQMKKVKEIADRAYNTFDKSRGLEALAASDPRLRVETATDFTLANGPPALGRDPAVIGKLKSLQPGEISKPFRVARGYLVMQLLSRSKLDMADFEKQKQTLRQQLLQQKSNQFVQAWLEDMRDKINIVDNRDRFYR